MNLEAPRQHIEAEHRGKPEVWLIDDDDDLSEVLIAYWRQDAPDFDYRHFNTAQAALDEIDAIAGSGKGSMPAIIFVDGNLFKDKGELRQGENLIQAILQREDITPPLLVAHSSSQEANERMLQAGGQHIVELGKKPPGAQDYNNLLTSYLEEHKDQEGLANSDRGE